MAKAPFAANGFYPLTSFALIVAQISLIQLAFMITILVLLKKDKSRKAGALLSVLFGVAFISYYFGTNFAKILYAASISIGGFSMINFIIILTLIPGLFLVAAGIHYFWKKT